MPAELQGYLPRRVKWSPAGRVLQALTVLLLAGAVASGIGLQIFRERQAELAGLLDRQGIPTEAEIVAVETRHDDGPRTVIVYRYMVGEHAYQGRQTLGNGDDRQAAVGAPVSVRYLASEPARSWLIGDAPRGVPAVVAILVPLLLGLLAWIPTVALRRQRRLLEDGRATAARVIGAQKVRRKEASGYRVEYEYPVLSGARRRVKLMASRKPPEPGTLVTLLYDVDSDRQAAAYPLPLVRVAKGI